MATQHDPNGDLQPYAYVTTPAITRILMAIAERCAVGETIKPGNRTIATWVDLASIGDIPNILARLHADEWIAYDGRSITLLRDPAPGVQEPRLHPDEIPGYLLSLPRQK